MQRTIGCRSDGQVSCDDAARLMSINSDRLFFLASSTQASLWSIGFPQSAQRHRMRGASMPIDEASKSQIRVTKLEAAKRQLTAAIRLFFDGGDEIAVHTLAVASYDILHTLSKRKGA